MPGIAGVLIGSRVCYSAITGELLYLLNKEPSQFRPALPKPAQQGAEQEQRQVA